MRVYSRARFDLRGWRRCCRPARPMAEQAGGLIGILAGELSREYTALKAKGDPPPYYMAYAVTEEQSDSESATLGALVSDSHNRTRGFDTTIRAGSEKFDNYHPFKGSRIQFTRFTALSLDDDANQIRRALWEESDRVYRLASRRLLQLKTDDQLLAEQSDKDADFSTEPAVQYSRLPENYHFDAEGWANKVRAWSAEFKSHPQNSWLRRECSGAERNSHFCEHGRLESATGQQSVPSASGRRGDCAGRDGRGNSRDDRSLRSGSLAGRRRRCGRRCGKLQPSWTAWLRRRPRSRSFARRSFQAALRPSSFMKFSGIAWKVIGKKISRKARLSPKC